MKEKQRRINIINNIVYSNEYKELNKQLEKFRSESKRTSLSEERKDLSEERKDYLTIKIGAISNYLNKMNIALEVFRLAQNPQEEENALKELRNFSTQVLLNEQKTAIQYEYEEYKKEDRNGKSDIQKLIERLEFFVIIAQCNKYESKDQSLNLPKKGHKEFKENMEGNIRAISRFQAKRNTSIIVNGVKEREEKIKKLNDERKEILNSYSNEVEVHTSLYSKFPEYNIKDQLNRTDEKFSKKLNENHEAIEQAQSELLNCNRNLQKSEKYGEALIGMELNKNSAFDNYSGYIFSSSQFQNLERKANLGGDKDELLKQYIDDLKSSGNPEEFNATLSKMKDELKNPNSIIHEKRKVGFFEKFESTKSVMEKFVKYAEERGKEINSFFEEDSKIKLNI